MMLRRLTSGILLLSSGAMLGCSPSATRLDGGGATFIEPLMLKWLRTYERETGVRVDYTGTGSGNGVQQMIRGALAFGCTDAPLNREQRDAAQRAGGAVVHIPLAMGGVVPIYRLPGVPSNQTIRFSGPVLADIFLGDVTRWDDPALRELNPGVALPSLPIRVVSRSDPSGTTAIFAEFLARSRPEAWAAREMGHGTSASFTVGIRQKGNPGVVGEVARIDGAIGYVELTFAVHMRDRVGFGAVRNRAGRFVVASPESITDAARSLQEIPNDLCFSLIDADGPSAYPISGTDWAVFYRRQPADRLAPLIDYLRWATAPTGGQRFAASMGYAPLPDGLSARVRATLDAVAAEAEAGP